MDPEIQQALPTEQLQGGASMNQSIGNTMMPPESSREGSYNSAPAQPQPTHWAHPPHPTYFSQDTPGFPPNMPNVYRNPPNMQMPPPQYYAPAPPIHNIQSQNRGPAVLHHPHPNSFPYYPGGNSMPHPRSPQYQQQQEYERQRYHMWLNSQMNPHGHVYMGHPQNLYSGFMPTMPLNYPAHAAKSPTKKSRRKNTKNSNSQKNNAKKGAKASRSNKSGSTNAEGKDTNKKNKIDPAYKVSIEKLNSGEERRTTMMVRNIPNRFTKDAMILEFNQHFEGEYDFFYLPIDFNNKCNVGYAFINFKTPKAMIAFHKRYNGNTWPKFKSNKVCAITFARLQGREAMLKHFEDSGGGERNFHLTCFHSNSSGDIKSLGKDSHGSNSTNSIQSGDTTASSEEDAKLTNVLHSNVGLAIEEEDAI